MDNVQTRLVVLESENNSGSHDDDWTISGVSELRDSRVKKVYSSGCMRGNELSVLSNNQRGHPLDNYGYRRGHVRTHNTSLAGCDTRESMDSDNRTRNRKNKL